MAGDVITRMGSHPPTHAYVELRTDDGLWAAHLRLLMALDRWAGSGRPRDGPHAVLESDRACCTGCGTGPARHNSLGLCGSCRDLGKSWRRSWQNAVTR